MNNSRKNRDENGKFVKGHKLNIGNKNLLGYKHTKSAKEKIGKSLKMQHKQGLRKNAYTQISNSLMQLGKNHPNFKGDEVGYHSLHSWVKRRKPKPQFCEKCHERKSYDLANISGLYKRDVNDFEWLCRKCHMKSDGRLEKCSIQAKKYYEFLSPIDKKCEYCGKKYQTKSKYSLYCSEKCKDRFWKQKNRKKINENQRKRYQNTQEIEIAQ